MSIWRATRLKTSTYVLVQVTLLIRCWATESYSLLLCCKPRQWEEHTVPDLLVCRINGKLRSFDDSQIAGCRVQDGKTSR